MEFAVAANQLKFHSALESIRKDHPYAEEIAWMDMDSDVASFLHQLDSVEDSKLKQYAVSLQNSKLELVFHALKKKITSAQKDKLLHILSIRVKKRFFNYNWVMLQEHYTNANLKESFALLAEFMKARVPAKYDLTLVSKVLDINGDLVEEALSVLEKEELSLTDFFIRYDFQKQSRLAIILLQKYFLQCSQQGFQANSNLFMDWIRQAESPPYQQIGHYLSVMDILGYNEEINQLLVSLYGEPGSSNFWNNIDKELHTKILEWNKLKDLGKYLGVRSEKFLFWKNYYNFIGQTQWYPDLGLVLLPIPSHVIVDIQKNKRISYLYKKSAFQKAFRAFEAAGGPEGQSCWPLDAEAVVPLKNFILENQQSDIYEVTYERLGKLYLRDYLEIIL